MRLMRLLAALAALAALVAAPARADTAPPLIQSLSPSSGPASGGTSVTIDGVHFGGATAVTFGGTAARSFRVSADETSITAVTPAGSGTVDVAVTTAAGTSERGSGARFRYLPAVTALAPSSGSVSGDTEVTITGGGFTGATAVTFGDAPAKSFTIDSDTRITATTPEGGGTVDVTVTGPSGTSAAVPASRYRYLLAVTASRPGPGGDQVTLTGIGFAVATQVRVKDAYAGFAALSDTQMVVVMPTGTAPSLISVVTPYGSTQGIDSGALTQGPSATATGSSPGSSFPPNTAGSPGKGDTSSETTAHARTIHLTGRPRVQLTSARAIVRVAVAVDAPALLRAALVDAKGRAVAVSSTRATRAGTKELRLAVRRARVTATGLYRVRVTVGALRAVSKPFRLR